MTITPVPTVAPTVAPTSTVVTIIFPPGPTPTAVSGGGGGGGGGLAGGLFAPVGASSGTFTELRGTVDLGYDNYAGGKPVVCPSGSSTYLYRVQLFQQQLSITTPFPRNVPFTVSVGLNNYAPVAVGLFTAPPGQSFPIASITFAAPIAASNATIVLTRAGDPTPSYTTGKTDIAPYNCSDLVGSM